MRLAAAIPAWTLSLVAAQAFAEPWLAPGDARRRHDLELLVDAGIVRAPLTAWPVSWAEVARDVSGRKPEAGQAAWLNAALARVQAAAGVAQRTGHPAGELRVSGSERPMAESDFLMQPCPASSERNKRQERKIRLLMIV